MFSILLSTNRENRIFIISKHFTNIISNQVDYSFKIDERIKLKRTKFNCENKLWKKCKFLEIIENFDLKHFHCEPFSNKYDRNKIFVNVSINVKIFI